MNEADYLRYRATHAVEELEDRLRELEGIVFVSGHRDLSEDAFIKYYGSHLYRHYKNGTEFIVGDCNGVDEMTQIWLAKQWKPKVTVYHMFEKPRVCASEEFKLSGGYTSDSERDTAMTRASTCDLAFFTSGREKSGTALNLLRRHRII